MIKKDELELLIVCFNITERKKAQREVERLNLENITEKINQQKIISSKIVENQENEQNRIAKEIHDGIGQMLTGLKFSLESINLDDREKSEQKIEYLKKLSLDIIKGVRTATFNLMPPELSDHGIVSSLGKTNTRTFKINRKRNPFLQQNRFRPAFRFPNRNQYLPSHAGSHQQCHKIRRIVAYYCAAFA